MLTRIMLRAIQLLAFAGVLLFARATASQAPANPPADSKQGPFVVFLGTGTPGPTPNRQGPSLAVVAGGKAYLVDVGVGVVRQADAAFTAGTRALSPRDLSIAFVTHLHSDHTIGLPDLILTPWVMGRTAPLELYGPPGIAPMADNILKAWVDDIHVRTTGLEHGNETGYKVNAHEVTPGVVYHDDNVKVTAFQVPHGSWPLALGYRFDAGGKSIVISGDTSPSENVVNACNGCDLLIHEVYVGMTVSTANPPPRWQQYMAAFHTSADQLSDIAARAHAKTLAVTHLAYMGNATEADLQTALKKNFGGKVVVAHDLEIVTP
jgi:ribonuclease BN (tRNA processing enzyme)